MHSWLANQIGTSAANVIISLLVLVVVIIAIFVTLAILRKINNGTFVIGGKSRTPRLSIRDAAAVDHTRRLVLVRRDNVEHLILIGGHNDVVIETNIVEPSSQYSSNELNKRSIKTESFSVTNRQDDHILNQRESELSAVLDNAASSNSQKTHEPHTTYSPKEENQHFIRNNSHVMTQQKQNNLQTHPQQSRSTDIKDNNLNKGAYNPQIPDRIRDDIVTAKIDGRREPKFSFNETSRQTDINLGEDFDRMFESELQEAIKTEKS
ncbi:flagellar biosynthetic protein FliO [Bartonella tamiae]|uniref:Flagellar biosynthetic protein FliO n=1 Tax=Bartonella tamiae Th239 TaxID=1094558 RepID=J0QZW1_9HYPH|nr:flagellar biosynthetic protein FliO [Bartonella tamiae]EJF88794.1 hypothetical protein ME5_01345 [Bartonella tamiae Th239]EJF94956.1 hypothetical protein MEG_00537 [Bartonella tamiae Th307]